MLKALRDRIGRSAGLHVRSGSAHDLARPRRRAGRLASLAAVVAATVVAGTVETENAVANGDTRTLSLIHQHTNESLTVTFKRDGRYDATALDQLNWLLRDWREAESTKMDPRLFDTVWEAQRAIGSTQPLRVVCGYRSPKTNGMLRRRSSGVAEHSQHMLGKAMDFFMTDASIDDIRAAGVRLQRGGVGWYPRSGSPFVHLDVGSVRAWPRMTRDQLARIFPDGKTVHLPADGKPMARYEEARAEILARGGTVLGYTALAQTDPIDGGGIKGFFAGLFGGDSGVASNPGPAPVPAATLGKGRMEARGKASVAVASADPNDPTGARQALAFAAPNSAGALRDAMLRRDGQEMPSAKALLTGQTDDQKLRAETGPESALKRTPLPPRRPSEFASLAVAIGASMPPPSRPVKVAAAGEFDVAGMALGTAPVRAASAMSLTSRLVPADAESGEQVRGLFQAIAQGASEPARRDAPVRLAAAQVRSYADLEEIVFETAGARTRFSAHSPGDELAASRFSGSATGPLPSAL